MVVENIQIKRICSFYVSEFHLGMILLPYISQKIEKKEPILIVSEKNLLNSIKELVSKVNLKEEIKRNEFEVIGAKFNNEYKRLDYVITEDGIVSLVDVSSKGGMRIYRRTLIYIMAKAFEELYKDVKIRVNYQLSNAMFCTVENMEITDGMLKNVENKMKEIDLLGNGATVKEKNMYAILELVLEMYERGINFLPIDLYKSHWKNFLVEDDGIRPPFGAISGLGPIAAESIYNAAKQEEFMSIDEIRIRAKIGDSTIDQLREFGILDGMQESNQISLFG